MKHSQAVQNIIFKSGDVFSNKSFTKNGRKPLAPTLIYYTGLCYTFFFLHQMFSLDTTYAGRVH